MMFSVLLVISKVVLLTVWAGIPGSLSEMQNLRLYLRSSELKYAQAGSLDFPNH